MANRSNSNGETRARQNRKPQDQSLAARTGRTITRQPYTSAAIATGAITAVAAAAAGAFFFSRRDKSLRETSDELGTLVKDSISSATSRVKEFVGSSEDGSSDTRSQQEIAEEALTLKETGAASNTPSSVNSEQSKVGAIAY